MNLDQPLIPMSTVPRQLRQCYSCTARSTGCGEYLDPHYVSKYIRPCPSSCVVFRNPYDHNLITRDCSTTWPQIHAKSGLHKLLGSDAFFCQESLCNGISFDFIMGIFHNQLPAVIKFPPMETIENSSTIIKSSTTTTTAVTLPISTTVDIDDDNSAVWEDPDSDFPVFKTTTTTISITSTSSTLLTEFSEVTDIAYESSSVPIPSMEHFDFIEAFGGGSSTIAGGLAVAQQDTQLNWWDFNDASIPPLIGSNNSPLITKTTTITMSTSTLISSTSDLTNVDQDEWSIFDTTTIPPITRVEHLSETNSELDFDMNDYFLNPMLSTTLTMNVLNNNNNDNDTSSFVPYYFTDYKPKEQLFDLIKPIPTLAMPPFSWMLNLANQNKGRLQNQKHIISKTLSTTSSTIATMKNNKNKKMEPKTLINNNKTYDYLYEYCNKKQCQNGGHLDSNCLCVCLPAFSGNNCEIGKISLV
ncbi:unnamed protein product [Rotaria sp. Silwood1]|nr:unnamed protein product [Rotaria sp. Silwood1]